MQTTNSASWTCFSAWHHIGKEWISNNSCQGRCWLCHRKKTLEVAEQETVVVLGKDIDLLVLLLHHVKSDHHDVFFCPGIMSGGKKAKGWNTKIVQKALGADVCSRILIAHAIGGCDTTSRMFNTCKRLLLKSSYCITLDSRQMYLHLMQTTRRLPKQEKRLLSVSTVAKRATP